MNKILLAVIATLAAAGLVVGLVLGFGGGGQHSASPPQRIQQQNNPAPTSPPPVVVKVPGPTVTVPAAPTCSDDPNNPLPYCNTPAQPTVDPWTVVQAFYADVNASNYTDAWNLMSPSQQAKADSYDNFVAGYLHHNSGQVSFDSESGDTVSVTVSSPTTNWSVTGWYQVDNGLITDGALH